MAGLIRTLGLAIHLIWSFGTYTESPGFKKNPNVVYATNIRDSKILKSQDFYLYINSQKKDNQGIQLLKRREGTGITASEIEFTDVFNKNDHSEVPFLSRSSPFMDDIVVSNEGVTKLHKVWTLPKL